MKKHCYKALKDRMSVRERVIPFEEALKGRMSDRARVNPFADALKSKMSVRARVKLHELQEISHLR